MQFKPQNLAPKAPAQLRPYQFTLARLVSWVLVAGSLCFLVRNVIQLVVAGYSVLPAIAVWGLFAGLGLFGAMWRNFWDTLPGRVLLQIMFLLVVIPFSPLLLFCLDWERWFGFWRSPVLPKSSDAKGRPNRCNSVSSVPDA